MKKYNCELNSILMFVAYSGLPQSQEKKDKNQEKMVVLEKKVRMFYIETNLI